VHFCERNAEGIREAHRSGTTRQREAWRVMERIARRERAKGARSGSPNTFFMKKIKTII
jgi:hypothetical protein